MVNEAGDNATGPVGPELLGRLIDRHAAALELYAGGLCDCPEDVLQGALVELAGRPEAPDNAVAWLYRAVRHRAINAQRAARRRRRHEAEAARRSPPAVVGPPTGGLDAGSVTAALEGLSSDQREVIVAHVWGELTFQEIGRLIGTSDSTAHRRYQSALAAMRQKLRMPCPKKS